MGAVLYSNQKFPLSIIAPDVLNMIGWVSAQAASANSITTPSMDTTDADLILVIVANAINTTVSAPTDSNSNTYTPDQAVAAGATNYPGISIFRCFSPTVGAGHTFSVSGSSGSNPAIVAIAIKGNGSSLTGSDGVQGSVNDVAGIQPLITTLDSLDVFVTALAHLCVDDQARVDSADLLVDLYTDNGGTPTKTGLAVALTFSDNPTGVFAPKWSHQLDVTSSQYAAAAACVYKGASLAVGKLDIRPNTVTWSSSNTGVATVSPVTGTQTTQAEVTAVAAGSCSITASGTRDSTGGTISNSLDVEVNADPGSPLVLSQGQIVNQ